MTDHTAREVAARANYESVNELASSLITWEMQPETTKDRFRKHAQPALDAIGYEEAAAIVRELAAPRSVYAAIDERKIGALRERARTWVSYHPAAKSVSAHPVEEA